MASIFIFVAAVSQLTVGGGHDIPIITLIMCFLYIVTVTFMYMAICGSYDAKLMFMIGFFDTFNFAYAVSVIYIYYQYIKLNNSNVITASVCISFLSAVNLLLTIVGYIFRTNRSITPDPTSVDNIRNGPINIV
jgi:hypothetical protein